MKLIVIFLALFSIGDSFTLTQDDERLFFAPAPVAGGNTQVGVVPMGCVLFGILCPAGYTPGGGSGGGTGGSGGSQAPANVDQFRADALNAHNRRRRAHCVPELITDAALQASAQAYAERLASTGTFAHSPEATRGQYGENLAMYSGGAIGGAVAVDAWYNEVSAYNYSNPGFSAATGHFTAVVWRGTTRVGTGVATNSRGQTFVVSHYSPPGNVSGQFEANVPRTC